MALIHAIPAPDATDMVRFLDEEYNASLAAEARKRIEALQLAAECPGTVFIDRGEPGRAVAKAASEFGADLVLIGRHSKSGLAAHLRQNAYAILRDSPCPVISV